MIMMPSTIDRVTANTSDDVNEQIRQQVDENVDFFASHPEWIEDRLRELDAEWDVERMLEMMAPTLTLTALTLSVTTSRKFLVIPFVVQAFLLMHAVQGWCPPLPVLRRLGFRTQAEIDRERYALKALRGDFVEIESPLGTKADRRAKEALLAVAR
jgi:hypothetical protein